MSYFKTCVRCGASLDPGEQCTCEKEKAVVSAPPPTTARVGKPHTKNKNIVPDEREKCKLIGETIMKVSRMDVVKQRKVLRYIASLERTEL